MHYKADIISFIMHTQQTTIFDQYSIYVIDAKIQMR